MNGDVSIAEAARQLGVVDATVRRWVREGAPCVELGSVGRHNGSRVNVAALVAWRGSGGKFCSTDRNQDELLMTIAGALRDTLLRDAGEGESAAVLLGIDRGRAAALLIVAYERIHRSMTGLDAATYPPEIEHLRSIVLSSRRTIRGPR